MNPSARTGLIGASVAATLASTAQALPPAAFTNGTIAAGNFYYAGGGSAQANAVFVAVRQLLQPATVDVYTDASPTAKHLQSASYLVVSGTTNGTGGLAAGTNIAFLYKYNGGAFPNGGLPQIGAGSNLKYPAPADLAGAAAVVPAPATPTSTSPNFTYTSTNGLAKLPDWGLTNEEITLFNFFDNLNGTPPQNLTSGVHQQPVYVTPYGIAVTTSVAGGAHPKTSFTKAEFGGILAGTVSDWSQLYADDGTQLAAGPVWLLDAGSGAGTKAAGNQYFLNYPGAIATSGSLNPGSVVGTNPNVYTGTILNTSLNTFQDVKEPSNASIVDDLLAANKTGGRAIGILSLEYPPVFAQNTAGVNDYVFAAINGTTIDSNTGTTDNINNPNAATPGTTKYSNIITGAYDFAFQAALNTRNGFTQPAFEAAVTNNLRSESLSGAHTGAAFPNASPGVLLDPTTTSAHDAGNLVWTRNAISPAPAQLRNDATVIGAGGIVFGPGDPL